LLKGATIATLAANIDSDPSLQAAIRAQVEQEGGLLHDHPVVLAMRTRRSGGASVMSYLGRAATSTAQDVIEYNLNDSAPFNYCILANAASYKPLPILRKSIGLANIVPGTFDLPSVHIIGLEDELKELSEQVAEMYDHESERQVYYLHGGHSIGRNTRKDDEVCAALQTVGKIALDLMHPPEAEPEPEWTRVSEITELAKLPGKQIALVRTKGITSPSTMQTISGALAKQPSDTVLMRIARAGDVRTTYGDTLKFIQPGGGGDLRRLGVKPGEVIAYGTPPGGSAAAAMAFICFGSQTCAAPLAPSTTKSDALSALEQFHAKHLVIFEGVDQSGIIAAFEEYAHHGDAKLHKVKITGDHAPGFFEFEHAASQLTNDELNRVGKPLVNPADGDCLMLRTSGTTSKPKGVPLKQGPIISNGAILAATIGLRPDDVCYGIMPLFHIGGLSATVACSLAIGASFTCDGAFNPEQMVAALTESVPKPTWYSSVPTIHNATVAYLNDNAEQYGVKKGVWTGGAHNLRMIRSGAAALMGPDGDALTRMYGDVPIFPTYSMSEQMYGARFRAAYFDLARL
jgi:hypothetical protein